MDGSKNDPDMSKSNTSHLDKPKKARKQQGKIVLVEDPVSVPKDPCEDITHEKLKIDEQIKDLNNLKKQYTEDCTKIKYFNDHHKDLANKKLLDLIKLIYNENIDTCEKLFSFFPETNEISIGGLTKPFIFEAMWKIIFLLKLDNVTTGIKRIYKISIEKDAVGDADNKIVDEYEYLNSEINTISNIRSGSSSGIADLYFVLEKSEKKTKKKSKTGKKEEDEDNTNPCKKENYTPEIGDVYLFTSKFYNTEKPVGNYDIAEIAINALQIYPKENFKIVALVKDGVAFSKKISGSSKEVLKSYTDSNLILDYAALSTEYYPKLYKWLQTYFTDAKKDINNTRYWKDILGKSTPIKNILDNLRFHQKYVVDYTDQIIEDKRTKFEKDMQIEPQNLFNPGRFIWGAVARSGKSFMIGGLVAKRKPKIVLLVLGAVNETKSQFIDELFKEYTDLKYDDDINQKGYDIIDFQTKQDKDKVKTKLKSDRNYVVVISQENLRLKVKQKYCDENPEDKIICKRKKMPEADETKVKAYDNTVIDIIQTILEEEDKIIFFDEIHQGSGYGDIPLQKQMIKFFYGNESKPYPFPLFIMVTATYSKPMRNYGKELGVDNEDCILIEWNYEMNMKMKHFSIENVTINKTTNPDIYLIEQPEHYYQEKDKRSNDQTIQEEIQLDYVFETKM